MLCFNGPYPNKIFLILPNLAKKNFKYLNNESKYKGMSRAFC